jgi:nitrogen fixation/metabolism regulation signal transduction histidine kinase
MGLLTDAIYAYGKAVKRALPILIVVTIILDALLFLSIEPASPVVIAFWLAVYVGSTFLVVTALYVFWLYITRSVSNHVNTDGSRIR